MNTPLDGNHSTLFVLPAHTTPSLSTSCRDQNAPMLVPKCSARATDCSSTPTMSRSRATK